MSNKSYSNRLPMGARIVVALCAGLFLVPTLHAQPTEETVDHRVLLAFDTSADMKKRLPSVQTVLKDFFFFEGSGQLREGDTIGVWTFGKEMHVGELPLQTWSFDGAGVVLTNIVKYVGKQPYGKETHFNQLMPLVNKLVQTSERMTVLIFCDGAGEFQGTPFDAGINQLFQQRQRAAQKAKMPFIIVLRSQLGQYVGCTVNFPKTVFNLPTFPPLPLPPLPPPPPVIKKAPPPPRVVIQPLIITGTNVGTNFPPPKPKVEITNTPTNIVTTNIVVLLPSSSGLSSGGALGIALSLLAAAMIVGILAWRRSRYTDSASLITRSMNRD